MNRADLSLESFCALANLAIKLRDNPRYMASVLWSYQEIEGIDERTLVTHLQTSPASFIRLALCIKPNTVAQDFPEQLRNISQYTNIDLFLLANLLRHVESIQSLAHSSTVADETPRFLAAARDHIDDDDNQTPEANNNDEKESKDG